MPSPPRKHSNSELVTPLERYFRFSQHHGCLSKEESSCGADSSIPSPYTMTGRHRNDSYNNRPPDPPPTPPRTPDPVVPVLGQKFSRAAGGGRHRSSRRRVVGDGRQLAGGGIGGEPYSRGRLGGRRPDLCAPRFRCVQLPCHFLRFSFGSELLGEQGQGDIVGTRHTRMRDNPVRMDPGVSPPSSLL